MANMTEEQIKSIAKEAAKEAISELFMVLGVNADDKSSLLDLQKDWAHTREARLGKEEFIKKGKIALIGAFISGALAVLINGLKHWSWN